MAKTSAGNKRPRTLAVIGLRGFPGVQGGVESHCQQLIPLLAQRFDYVRVYRRNPYLTEASQCEISGIGFVDLPSTRIKGFEAVWHTLLCILHLMLHSTDAVNVHNIGPGMFTPILRLLGMKVILTYHSPNYEHAKWGKLSRLLLKACETVSLHCSHRIIFVSPMQRAKYPQWVQQKSVAIPNGIVPAEPCTDTDFLEKHGIKAGQYLLAVGRITPEKGFEYLVQAVNLDPRIEQLVIAGSSDHSPQAIDKLRHLDTQHKTIFTGYTTGRSLQQLYTHARMFVLSSVNEGFPMVLLEAMSYHLPIVATDIPAANIIPLHPAHYAKPANPHSLASAIIHVLESTDTHTDYNIDQFCWDTIADSTYQEYLSSL